MQTNRQIETGSREAEKSAIDTSSHQDQKHATSKHISGFGGHDLDHAEKGLPNDRTPWTATRVIAMMSLCVVYVGSQIVLYFVSSALLPISQSLGTRYGNWMLTANTLAVAAVCPFVGYITDLLGRRWMCLFGSLCLVIASIVQATANTLGQAIAAQAVGGIGAGICELTALAGVAELTPTRWRGVTLAIVTFSIVPFMPQLLYTVLIIQSSTWRYCFLLTGLWNLVGLIGCFFCYKPPARHALAGELLKRIDWVGGFLSIVGITLFLVGLQAGGYQYPWISSHTLAPLIIGGLLIIAFIVWEISCPHQFPMVPAAIFKGQRVVALAYIIVFVAGMDFYSILGFFPIVLEYVYNTDAITVGVRGLCYPWAILGGACIVSYLMSYTRGHIRTLFLISAAIMTAFTAALAVNTPDNAAKTITLATFAAFGNGALVVPALTLALFAAPDEFIGTAGALSLSVRFLGGSIGTSIYFNVFNTQIANNLPNYIVEAVVQTGASVDTAIALVEAYATQDPRAPLAVPNVSQATLAAAQDATQWAYADSLKYVWYTTIPFGVISCLCCAFLPSIKPFMTNKIAVDLH